MLAAPFRGRRQANHSPAKLMARKASLTVEALADLGARKLAELIFEEAKDNAAFRKRANAALAGAQGAEAVAALIDRRLAALEKARSTIYWGKEKDFTADLKATADTITGELAALDPALAMQRLVRFLATHGGVFNRVEDSSGRLQAVYGRAAAQTPELVRRMTDEGRAGVPALFSAALGKDTHGFVVQAAVEAVGSAPDATLAEWDSMLSRGKAASEGVVAIRQAIAEKRGDLDGFIALEAQRPEWRRNPLRVAEKLLAAKRFEEALDWARRENRSSIAFMSAEDFADGRSTGPYAVQCVALEARILEARGDRAAAQALRWSAFEMTLKEEALRAYIAGLDDFQEFDELDRAFALAESSPQAYSALALFLAWPRLDRAARLVVARSGRWEGRHYSVLAEAASLLEADYPLAATILYRALLDDILVRGHFAAYGHGARYLVKLRDLAESVAADSGLEDHPAYLLELAKAHGREHDFWFLLEEADKVAASARPSRGR
jgi:hypothetical protein